MRTAIISSVKEGMATVVYSAKKGDASNPMPIFDTLPNRSLRPGDKVIVAELNGKKDGIVMGKYWNSNNYPQKE